MKKRIYKITNLINQKIYIGQTNRSLKERFTEHCNNNYFSLITEAIKKYGKENFVIEELYYGEDYNEKEKFYIRYYDSQNNGYNIADGGEDPPIHYGDESPFAIFDHKWFLEIVNLIQNTKLNFDEIADIQKCHKSTISRINIGKIRKQDNLLYPLRKTNIDKKDIQLLKWFLINTDFHREELCEMFNCSISTIKATRNGQNHFDEKLSYPLGGKDVRMGLKTNNKIQLIKKQLIDNINPLEICKKFKISFLRLQYINEGRIYFEEGIFYPLNSNIEKAVETRDLIVS